MIAEAILVGLASGLTLSVFLGPIFFTMLQLGVEHGYKAALMLAMGQWTSDFIYIGLAFWGAVWVEQLLNDAAQQATFIAYMGTIGGILLLILGGALLFTQSVSTKGSERINVPPKRSAVAYLAYFGQGFLINVANPTPLFFWTGLMALAIKQKYSGAATVVLYGTVMFIVILTDSLKVLLARSIRRRLRARHFLYIRRLAGAIVAGFGLVLLLNGIM